MTQEQEDRIACQWLWIIVLAAGVGVLCVLWVAGVDAFHTWLEVSK